MSNDPDTRAALDGHHRLLNAVDSLAIRCANALATVSAQARAGAEPDAFRSGLRDLRNAVAPVRGEGLEDDPYIREQTVALPGLILGKRSPARETRATSFHAAVIRLACLVHKEIAGQVLNMSRTNVREFFTEDGEIDFWDIALYREFPDVGWSRSIGRRLLALARDILPDLDLDALTAELAIESRVTDRALLTVGADIELYQVKADSDAANPDHVVLRPPPDEARQLILERIHPSQPGGEPPARPPLAAPPTYLPSTGFKDRSRHWAVESSLAAGFCNSWVVASGRHNDRPGPPGGLLWAWQCQSDWTLLAQIDPKTGLASLADLAEWEQTARGLLKLYTASSDWVTLGRVLILERPVESTGLVVSPGTCGFLVHGAMSETADWLQERVRTELDWGAFAADFGFLAEDRPLTAVEKELAARIAVSVVIDSSVSVVTELYRKVVGISWDAMRARLEWAPLPVRPDTPTPITEHSIDVVFDLVASWLYAAGLTGKPKGRRDQPARPDATSRHCVTTKRRGHPGISDEERRKMIADYQQWQSSGLTQREYLRERGYFPDMSEDQSLAYLDRCRKQARKG